MSDNTNHKNIVIQYPVLNHEEAVAHIAIDSLKIENNNTSITIEDALSTYQNNLFLVVLNEGHRTSYLTVKAGDAYPNSMLGDTVIELTFGFSAINLADLPRFIKADNSIDIEFKDDFVGRIFAIGKYKLNSDK